MRKRKSNKSLRISKQIIIIHQKLETSYLKEDEEKQTKNSSCWYKQETWFIVTKNSQ